MEERKKLIYQVICSCWDMAKKFNEKDPTQDEFWEEINNDSTEIIKSYEGTRYYKLARSMCNEIMDIFANAEKEARNGHPHKNNS